MGSVASRSIFEGKYFLLKIKTRSLAEVEAFFFFDNLCSAFVTGAGSA